MKATIITFVTVCNWSHSQLLLLLLYVYGFLGLLVCRSFTSVFMSNLYQATSAVGQSAWLDNQKSWIWSQSCPNAYYLPSFLLSAIWNKAESLLMSNMYVYTICWSWSQVFSAWKQVYICSNDSIILWNAMPFSSSILNLYTCTCVCVNRDPRDKIV